MHSFASDGDGELVTESLNEREVELMAGWIGRLIISSEYFLFLILGSIGRLNIWTNSSPESI